MSENNNGNNPQNGSFPDPNIYTSENHGNKKCRKKKHSLLKGISFVLCLAIVGAGSIQAYKFFSDDRIEVADLSENDEAFASHKTSRVLSEEEVSVNDAPAPSLIQIASRTDAKYLPDIVDSIMPSVVGVASTFELTQTYNTWGWGGFAPQAETQQVRGTGTGIIMSEDGYIITNAHVVYETEYDCGKAIEVSVVFSDETEHDAKIIAYDTETDLAVLKVDETGLTPAEFGNSDELRVGELVIAVGNPLGFDLFGSVTSGIVSAKNRNISINEKNMSLIQTDAAINAGNSGGPLLNSSGQVIGINSAKMSSSYGEASVEGLGFAIPINEAKTIIDDLINYKYVKGRPQIGISTVDITEAYSKYRDIPMGVYVYTVEPDSAAEWAGLKVGDVIIAVEGEPIKTVEELNNIKSQYKAGDTITLTVSRDGKDLKIKVLLQEAGAKRPEEDDEEFFKDDVITPN
ncbi:MAG: trypsin-like peptidase domain-containing protein [Ruminococcus sp.]|nr:trypsin-like peptidase domain-containing protein [Ruminococcus sp.]